MNRSHSTDVFRTWDKKGKYVFSKHELHKLFSEDSLRAFKESLNRLVTNKSLI